MGKVGKILGVAALIALAVFTPYLAPIIGGFIGLTGFLATAVGSIILAAGILAIQMLMRPGSPSMDAGRVNVKIAEPERWLNAGIARQGGAVLYAEFDSAGNLWYLVVHSDSILVNALQYYLDDEPVTLSGNVVQEKEFRLKTNKDKDPADADGTGAGYVSIWTTTYTLADPTPPGLSAFKTANPLWTNDHKLVGTTYSVVKMGALKAEHRYKIYKWRGPLGLGEPAISIVGEWSLPYDPRTETYAFTRNPILIWAWFRTHRYGRNKSFDSINWDRVAEQANICDQIVTGISGSHVRYECGVGIVESKERHAAEQEIMLSCDGQLFFDDDGKCWMRAGYYTSATLSLSRNRDIVAMESVEATNGESETQGVIVRYTDPDSKYIAQPCAPWYNPLYYNEGEAAQFLVVTILTCQNHNQAMRLAKGIGMRSQPLHKIVPTVGLRGLRARQERIVNINYDNTFAGEYEIVTPVEVDESGLFCGWGSVPIDENRWTLLPGEEKAKGSVSSGPIADPLDPPTVTTVDYRNGRIEAVFTAPAREDVSYRFQYIAADDVASDEWLEMTVDMDALIAYSDALPPGIEYLVHYRSVTLGGRVSDWSDPPTELGYSLSAGGLLQQTIYNSYIFEVAQGVAVITIASDGTLTIDDHHRVYNDGHPSVAVDGDVIATGLAVADERAISYDDLGRLGGAVTYTLHEGDAEARSTLVNPGRHYVGYFVVPSSGSSSGGGGGIPGGGGFCVTTDTPILMANVDHDEPGMQKVAGDLKVGDWLWTQHEITLAYGAYQIEAISFIEQPVYSAPGLPRATAAHRFWRDGDWQRMDGLGEPDGTATVAKITVQDAHTYISAGVLSHNAKDSEPEEPI